MSGKPNKNDFMHKGVLMTSAYDAALKAWESGREVTVISTPTGDPEIEHKPIAIRTLVPDSNIQQQVVVPDSTTNASGAIIEPTTTETLVFKIGNTISWKITPINKGGTAAQIQIKSLKVISEPPSVEVSPTGENSFALIPFQVGSSQLIISFTSMYGKLVTKTYKLSIVDGADEAIDMKVEYTIQG